MSEIKVAVIGDGRTSYSSTFKKILEDLGGFGRTATVPTDWNPEKIREAVEKQNPQKSAALTNSKDMSHKNIGGLVL